MVLIIPTKRKVLICDIDGTIADLAHRRVYIITRPKNYAAFEAGIPDDKPIQHIIDTVISFRDMGWFIIMCSGRGAQQREVTLEWMSKHGVPCQKLYMRAEKDYRADDIVKGELLDQILADGHEPALVLDDRDRVVAMWRERGIPCVQVAPGNF